MRQTTIWTAAAAAVTFGVMDAQAAPRTFDLQFTSTTPGDTSFGAGFFTIDDGILATPGTYSDPSLVLDFQADFFGTPFGNLSFDEGDLNALNLKVFTAGQLGTVSFGTTQNGSDPFLIAGFFNSTILTANDSDPNTTDPLVTYATTVVPEPGSLALLAAGAAAIPLLRRRRAKRADA